MDPNRPSAQPRQRWRLAFRRREDAHPTDSREAADAWDRALLASGLPLSRMDRAPTRPRASFGAPIATAFAAERDLVDIFLTDALPVSVVREGLERVLPSGIEVVDLHDVWVGAPPLPAAVIAHVYRATLVRRGEIGTLEAEPLDREDVARAVRAILDATTLPRRRPKGGREVAYDLRPLLADVRVTGTRSTDHGVSVRIVVRVDPEKGTGRPEEVVAALGDALREVLDVGDLVRERLVTADEGMPTA